MKSSHLFNVWNSCRSQYTKVHVVGAKDSAHAESLAIRAGEARFGEVGRIVPATWEYGRPNIEVAA